VAEPLTGNFAEDDASTAPIDISAIIARGDDGAGHDGSGHDGSGHDGSVHDGVGDEDAAQAEALRASDAALRRWRAD
jgi:hypothetical protein